LPRVQLSWSLSRSRKKPVRTQFNSHSCRVRSQVSRPRFAARHFACDAATEEMLWFPGAPPMHVARAAPPLRHRLEYLHFLAKKYAPELAVDEKADMTADAKPQQQEYISASEKVTEILNRD
ncbi:hypothetical protein C8R46DRAFT_1061541, partial [Mycena filopes]